MTSNAEAAEAFREIADLLDLRGERFKPEAYRRAARSIEALGEDLGTLVRRGALHEIPGVGEAIAEKIREYLRDGRISYRDRLIAEVPAGIVELLRLPGLGPKTARRFWIELGITGPEELRAALTAGRLDGVKGFGPKKIAQILAALDAAPPATRTPLWEATRIAGELMAGLRAAAAVERLEAAGSLRRARETVGDLDLLATSHAPEAVLEAFAHLPRVRTIRLRGDTKETVILENGMQVDLRVVAPGSFGAALQYFTGSKDHNVRLRSRARELGLKVNEYGVYREEDRIAGASEAEVYRALGLPEIPPELREDRGEIDAAEAGKLPRLLELPELRGDLHVHLPAIPGPAEWGSLFDSVRAAGHRYVGLVPPEGSDRSAFEELRRAASERAAGVRIYWAYERGIATAFGPIPEGFDFAIAVPESASPGPPPPPREASTENGGALRILGHLGLSRAGTADLDLGVALAWIRWSGSSGAALEIPPIAPREGLDSTGARTAHERGVPLLVTGASKGLVEPDRLRVAVALARRAGLGPEAVLNTGDGPWGSTTPRPTPPRRRGKGGPGRKDGHGPRTD